MGIFARVCVFTVGNFPPTLVIAKTPQNSGQTGNEATIVNNGNEPIRVFLESRDNHASTGEGDDGWSRLDARELYPGDQHTYQIAGKSLWAQKLDASSPRKGSCECYIL